MTRLKKALKLSENITFQRALNKFTTAAALFTILCNFEKQGKNCLDGDFKRMKSNGIDWHCINKALDLEHIHRWFRFFFVLPSPLTLSRMISRASLKPGVNKNLFAQVKKKAQKMTPMERLCILLFDEIYIKPHFDYNRRKDHITGFVNNGQYNIKKRIADHALVFMIRGIKKKHNQPIAYTFCAGSTQEIDLAMQIKEMVINLNAIGFKVIATVCDQGATNVSAINYLMQPVKNM